MIGIEEAAMPSELPLQCRCGHMRGVAREVAPEAGFRLICYCKDCQAFARFLDRPDVLDAAGGTDIVQMPIGRVKLTAGADALSCLRLSETVFRWYCDCCKTPIGNTAGPGFPIIGLIHSFISPEIEARSRNQMLGSPLCRIFDHSAVGPLPLESPPPATFGVFMRRAIKLIGWWLRGLGRPNPFFDDRTKAPRTQPRVLTPQERAALGM